MSVQELEKAVAQLPEAELVEFARWFEAFRQEAWDRRIARDAKAGRFDDLIARAKEQYAAGRCKPV